MSYTRSSDVLEGSIRVVKRVAKPIHTRSKKKCVERTVTVSNPTDYYPAMESSKNSAFRHLPNDFANHSTSDEKPLLENTRSAVSPKLEEHFEKIPSTHGKIVRNCMRNIPVEPTTSEPPQEMVHVVYNPQPAVLGDVPETRNLDIFWLKSESAIAVQYYKGEVFVHVREYFQDKNTGHFLPTKRGVRMNLDTYYDFGRKIFGFANTLCYPTESVVVGSSVLAIVENDKLRLQNFTKSTLHYEYILLDMHQLQILRESIYDVDNAVLRFLYSDLLYSLVCDEKSVKESANHPHLQDLKHLIEVDLTSKIETLFFCEGCAFNMYQHECQTKTLSEKYETLQSPVSILCDVQSVAQKFLADHAKIQTSASEFEAIYNHLFLANPVE